MHGSNDGILDVPEQQVELISLGKEVLNACKVKFVVSWYYCDPRVIVDVFVSGHHGATDAQVAWVGANVNVVVFPRQLLHAFSRAIGRPIIDQDQAQVRR
jgi:hypothetical protein